MTINFYCNYPATFYSRPIATPPPDWVEIETGPGPIDLPENQEYGFRIHNIDNQDLKTLVAEIAEVSPLT